MGKKILPGLKKLDSEKIKFITYLYEGFRGENSSILTNYNNKYNQRNLDEIEKDSIIKLLEINNNSRFYNDVFSSLQILMKEIIKENYEQDYSLYKIIEKLPKYIILNEELISLFKKYNNNNDKNCKLFSVNSLVGIFDYFEALCWDEIKKHIPPDYKQELSEEIIKYIIKYFEQKNINKIINKQNLTDSLRKLISRSISGDRQDTEIKNDAKLRFYIIREDLWHKNILNSDKFEEEINVIFKYNILIGQAVSLYSLLDGDNILYEKLFKNKKYSNNKIIQINNSENKNKKSDNNKNLNKINIKEKEYEYKMDTESDEEINDEKNENEIII